MVSKEAHTRARKARRPNPNPDFDWTALFEKYNFERPVVDQLKAPSKKAFLAAVRSSLQTKSLPPHWIFVVYQAAVAGYLQGKKSERVGGRVPKSLISAAMKKSGIQSQTELLEYALSKVALEDDYGKRLLSLKGSIPDDVEF